MVSIFLLRRFFSEGVSDLVVVEPRIITHVFRQSNKRLLHRFLSVLLMNAVAVAAVNSVNSVILLSQAVPRLLIYAIRTVSSNVHNS